MNLPSEKPQASENVDRIGAVASSLCALHCAVCALLPAVFGALGLGFLLNQQVEWALSLFAIAFAAGALLQGWRLHRSPIVMSLMSIGIVGLLASRGLEMGSSHDHHGHGEHDSHSEAAGHHDGDHEAEHPGAEAHAEHHEDHHSEKSKSDNEPHEHHGADGHAEKHDDHNDHGDEEHSDGLHSLGAVIGVLGGLLLFTGHLLNIREFRSLKAKQNQGIVDATIESP